MASCKEWQMERPSDGRRGVNVPGAEPPPSVAKLLVWSREADKPSRARRLLSETRHGEVRQEYPARLWSMCHLLALSPFSPANDPKSKRSHRSNASPISVPMVHCACIRKVPRSRTLTIELPPHPLSINLLTRSRGHALLCCVHVAASWPGLSQNAAAH